MPKGPQGQKRPADTIGNAVMIGKIATGELEDTSYVQPNKRKSGIAGAKARKDSLDAKRRSQIATKAAIKRWGNEEDKMENKSVNSLHALLNEGGRELVNIKFLAGFNPTIDGMCNEAAKVIKSAIDKGAPHQPPITGKQKSIL